jgi:hypothetical protein
MAINELWIPSPHYSTGRSAYNKIVFHTTQGAMKIRDLGSWFQNPSAQCSSHHGADSYERGLFGAYVYENYAAWTQGNANGYCLSIELCGFAEWSRSEWLNNRPILVDNAAEWLRYMVDKYSVPWTLLSDSQAQNASARGICQHVNLGSWGSGHWDCGDGFPIDVILDKAKHWGGSTEPIPPKPEPILEDDDLMISIPPADVDNREFGISLPGAFSAMGLCADASLYGDSIHLRCAFHRHNNTGFDVVDAYVDRSHVKVVIRPPNKFDGVSLKRIDNMPVNVTPDFGR